jgi:hypothetical protein
MYQSIFLPFVSPSVPFRIHSCDLISPVLSVSRRVRQELHLCFFPPVVVFHLFHCHTSGITAPKFHTILTVFHYFVSQIYFYCNTYTVIFCYLNFIQHLVLIWKWGTVQYFGTTLTNQNMIQEEIKRRLNSGNDCYHSVQNLLSSRLLSKNIKIRIHKTIILPVVLYGCETWSLDIKGGT